MGVRFTLMRRGENFPLLDGLRGIAAVAVLLFHAQQILSDQVSTTSAYLAVDFFFILSGFVVCAAYGQRLDHGLSWGRFMTIRMIRLWPMLVIGAVLGGLVWTVNRFSESTPLAAMGEGGFVTISAALLLPAGLLLGLQAYPVVNPIWSLFFEIVANALYALRQRLFRAMWVPGAILCALVLAVTGCFYGSIATFGFNDPAAFLLGLPRVIVPFSLGVFLYRKKIHLHFASVPAWLPPLVLMGTFMVCIPDAQPFVPDQWPFDLAATLIIFPAIVAAAAGCRMGRGTQLASIAGELSYPAYLVHQPILRGMHAASRLLHLAVPVWIMTALAIAVTIAVSWLLLQFIDKPARRALDRRFLRDRQQREVLLQPAL